MCDVKLGYVVRVHYLIGFLKIGRALSHSERCARVVDLLLAPGSDLQASSNDNIERSRK